MSIKPVNKFVKLIKELNSTDILKGLLGFGLFPDKASHCQMLSYTTFDNNSPKPAKELSSSYCAEKKRNLKKSPRTSGKNKRI